LTGESLFLYSLQQGGNIMSTSLETKQFPIQNVGIDWLSIRSKQFDVCAAYSALAFDVFKDAKESGEKVEQAVRVGFGGRAVAGLFLGHREDTSLLTLSSDVARRYGPVALRLGGSVESMTGARLTRKVKSIVTGATKSNSKGVWQKVYLLLCLSILLLKAWRRL
jgi:hypothetical protein